MTVIKEGAIARFTGLSTDTKPTGATIPKGSTFYEYDTNDTYFTPDNTTWIPKDIKSIKKFKVTTTVSASAAYTSGDVVANTGTASSAITWDFLAVAGYNGGSGKIVQAQVETNANVCSITPTLFFYTVSNPGCTLADNAVNTAPVQTDVSKGIYLGKIDFPIVANVYSVSANANSYLYPTASTLPFYFTTPSTADDLHAVMVTNTGATFASKEIAVTLWVQRL